MSDLDRHHRTIVEHDLEHLVEETRRIELLIGAGVHLERGIASNVRKLAEATIVLLRLADGDVVWAASLRRGTLDDLIQSMGRALEQIDPAREAVAS